MDDAALLDSPNPAQEAWTSWADKRPEDHRALYWWRVPERKILSKVIRMEWTAEMRFVGMGYSSNEWWPPFSDWDGYSRTLPAGTEWRSANAEEKGILLWHGLDLSPDPWTGKPPKVEGVGRWIGAPPYAIEAAYLRCRFGSTRWDNLQKMQDAWNDTPPTERSA